MIIYGTDLCKDCVACKQDLDNACVTYEYRNISNDLMHMKEFLRLRDQEPVFAEVKADNRIGIPAIIADDGTITLTWEAFI